MRDQATAVIYKQTKTAGHFDCILNDILKTEELKPNESICYLGRGSFGILSFRNSSGPLRFLIRKRIQYEDREEFLEWRKSRS
jgi:hypothetical protein